jgi:hypothetical protein
MAHLSTLPPELLEQIFNHLPLPARTALKVTCRRMYSLTPPLRLSKAGLVRCAQRAITSYLAFDHYRRLCPICKQWYPNHMFADEEASTPTVDEERRITDTLLQQGFDDAGGPGMVEPPPGACIWHKASLYRIIDGATPALMPFFIPSLALKDGLRGEHMCKWISTVQEMCYHCGAVRWREKKFHCRCETCGVRRVRCYTRFVMKQSEVDRFCFFTREREIWVREWKGKCFLLY